MHRTLIQLNDVPLIGVGILSGKGGSDFTQALVVETGILPKEGLTGQGLNQAIEPNPLKTPLLSGHRRHTRSGNATAVEGLEAEAAFIFDPITEVQVGRNPYG